MYIIRDRKSKRILHINKAPLTKRLKAEQVYPGFNKKTMELLKSSLDRLPMHYTIDAKGHIKPMPVKEQVKQGLVAMGAHQKIEGNAIVTKSLAEQVAEGLRSINEPFEWIDENDQLARRTPEQLVAGKHITTEAHLEQVNRMVNARTNKRIEQAYPVRTELRITKDFTLWMYEERPANDAREEAMLDMEAFVNSTRDEARALKVKAAKQAGIRVEEKAAPKPAPAPRKPKASAPEPASAADTQEVPDEYWTVAALRKWLAANDISYVNRDSKSELLEKINAARS